MFDLGWSELLILAVVTLLFVGPKDLPVFLRTIGRFTGMIRKQAGEFRAQFDEAMRESELDQIRKDMSGLRDEVGSTMRQAQRSVENDLNATGRELDSAAGTTTKPPQAQTKPLTSSGGNGSAALEAPSDLPAKLEPEAEVAPASGKPADSTEKSRV